MGKAMTFQNCFRKCCGKEEVFPEPESESPTPKNSWEKLRALKEEIAKPAKTWEDKPRSSANPIKRATITIDLPIQEEPVLESLCEKTNIEMGPVVFGVSNSERRSLLENISNTEEGAEILKSRKTLSNYISDVKGVGSQLGIGLSKPTEKTEETQSYLSSQSQSSMRSRSSRREKPLNAESRNTFKDVVSLIISQREAAGEQKRKTMHEIKQKESDRNL